MRDFSCQCAAGYSGRTCETKLDDCNIPSIGCTACDASPCIHGNCNCTCTPSEMFYNCTCKEGYTGVNCSQDINECINGSVPSNICGDNGTCNNVDGSFRCNVSFSCCYLVRSRAFLLFSRESLVFSREYVNCSRDYINCSHD